MYLRTPSHARVDDNQTVMSFDDVRDNILAEVMGQTDFSVVRRFELVAVYEHANALAFVEIAVIEVNGGGHRGQRRCDAQ